MGPVLRTHTLFFLERPNSAQKPCARRMLTCDLFAVANLLSSRYVGATALLFERCRSPMRAVGGQRFVIGECPVGEAISIQSCRVGVVSKRRCQEKHASCLRSIRHPAIASCNGRRSCSFGQSVLRYPQGRSTKPCAGRMRDANYITIKYRCTVGKIRLLMRSTMIAVILNLAFH